jgi:hypothetical protein
MSIGQDETAVGFLEGETARQRHEPKHVQTQLGHYAQQCPVVAVDVQS